MSLFVNHKSKHNDICSVILALKRQNCSNKF